MSNQVFFDHKKFYHQFDLLSKKHDLDRSKIVDMYLKGELS